MTIDLEEWSRRLRRIAQPVLAETPAVRLAGPEERAAFAERFTDEAGHRRVWDRFLLARVLRVPAAPRSEAWLWSWHAALGLPAAEPPASPPFFARPDAWTLEQETEKELSGLHGWTWLLRDGVRDARFEAAMDWVLANIQPDNATNHPWAIHAFLRRAARGDDFARLYAEAMLHCSIVHLGRPDRLSAFILLDAADHLHSESRGA